MLRAAGADKRSFAAAAAGENWMYMEAAMKRRRKEEVGGDVAMKTMSLRGEE